VSKIDDRSPTQRARALAREQARDRDELQASPVPWRITLALDSRGLDGPEVDIACGVVEPAVDQWERGEVVPTREQVEALATLTDYPARWFYLRGDPPTGVTWVCSRSGPKGKRCQVIDNRPDADVVPLHAQGGLW
jgi:hypothetical protein